MADRRNPYPMPGNAFAQQAYRESILSAVHNPYDHAQTLPIAIPEPRPNRILVNLPQVPVASVQARTRPVIEPVTPLTLGSRSASRSNSPAYQARSESETIRSATPEINNVPTASLPAVDNRLVDSTAAAEETSNKTSEAVAIETEVAVAAGSGDRANQRDEEPPYANDANEAEVTEGDRETEEPAGGNEQPIMVNGYHDGIEPSYELGPGNQEGEFRASVNVNMYLPNLHPSGMAAAGDASTVASVRSPPSAGFNAEPATRAWRQPHFDIWEEEAHPPGPQAAAVGMEGMPAGITAPNSQARIPLSSLDFSHNIMGLPQHRPHLNHDTSPRVPLLQMEHPRTRRPSLARHGFGHSSVPEDFQSRFVGSMPHPGSASAPPFSASPFSPGHWHPHMVNSPPAPGMPGPHLHEPVPDVHQHIFHTAVEIHRHIDEEIHGLASLLHATQREMTERITARVVDLEHDLEHRFSQVGGPLRDAFRAETHHAVAVQAGEIYEVLEFNNQEVFDRIAASVGLAVSTLDGRLRDTESRLHEMLTNMDERTRNSVANLDELRSDFNRLRFSFDEARLSFDRFRGGIDELRGRHDGVDELRDTFDQLRGNVHGLRGDFDQLRGVFDQLRGDIHELRGSYDVLHRRVDEQDNMITSVTSPAGFLGSIPLVAGSRNAFAPIDTVTVTEGPNPVSVSQQPPDQPQPFEPVPADARSMHSTARYPNRRQRNNQSRSRQHHYYQQQHHQHAAHQHSYQSRTLAQMPLLQHPLPNPSQTSAMGTAGHHVLTPLPGTVVTYPAYPAGSWYQHATNYPAQMHQDPHSQGE